MNFWNLRAADLDLMFYDPDYDPRLRPSVDHFLNALRQRPTSDSHPWAGGIAGWVKNVPGEIRTDLGNDIYCRGMDDALRNGFSIKPAAMYLKGDYSTLGSVDENYGTPSLAVALSKKPFYDDLNLHNQHVVVSVRFFGGLIENSDAVFQYPYLPELNEYYSRETHVLLNAVRSEQEGLGIITKVTTNDLRIAALPKHDLIAKIFAAFGMKCEPSQPGRIATRLIRQMGGIQGCRVFKIAGVRKLIEAYNPLESFTRGAALQLIGEINPNTGKPNFDRYEGLFLGPRQRPKLKPEDAFTYLLRRGVFRAGLKLLCPNCDLSFWQPLDSLATEVECEYCGQKFDITPQLRDRDWAFRRSGLFGKNDHQEGSIPVAVTLQQLNTITNWDSLFTTNMNLDPDGVAIDPCETDLIFLSWHASDRLELAIGECKSPGEEITDQDISNLTKVADAFPQERIDVYIVFSKTGTFTDAEIARCKKASDDYAHKYGKYRIIILAQRELEPYFVYEWAEKEFNIRRTAISLGDLARGTVDIYFNPRPKTSSTAAANSTHEDDRSSNDTTTQ